MGLIVAVVVVTTIVKKGTPSFRRVLLQVNSNFGEEKKQDAMGLIIPRRLAIIGWTLMAIVYILFQVWWIGSRFFSFIHMHTNVQKCIRCII